MAVEPAKPLLLVVVLSLFRDTSFVTPLFHSVSLGDAAGIDHFKGTYNVVMPGSEDGGTREENVMMHY